MEPIENKETKNENVTPFYFVLDRRVIGVMDAAKRAIEATAAATCFSQYPWLAAVLIILRVTFSSIITFSKIKNPIEK